MRQVIMVCLKKQLVVCIKQVRDNQPLLPLPSLVQIGKKPPSTTILMRHLKVSVPNTKRYSERGSPFHNLVQPQKKPVGVPFTKIEKEVMDIHHFIPFIHFFQSPFCSTLANESPNSKYHTFSQYLACIKTIPSPSQQEVYGLISN